MVKRWMQGLVVGLMLAASSAAQAQERVEDVDLPRHVEEEVVAFFNRTSTIRFQGRSEIPEGTVVQSDVAVLRGPFTVAGELDGDLMVVNGDLSVVGEGRITGNVTVIGGAFVTGQGAVDGQVAVYSGRVEYSRRGDRLVIERAGPRRRDYTRTSSRISVRNEGTYNRVEGLPVMVGPVVRTAGDQFTRFDAMAIWRTDRDFDPDQMGYFVRGEQHFGPEGRFTLGGTAHSLVEPMERWGLTDSESSLATFLFHSDSRDYYEREGFSAFLGYEDRGAGVSLRAEYREETHAFAPAGSPWTLRDNDDPWRPQPLVAEGDLQSLRLGVTVDDRNDPEDPSDGWYMDTYAVFGLGGDLTVPAYLAPGTGAATLVGDEHAVSTDFRTGFMDLRRYARLGPAADIRIRGVVAGSLNENPLPPQFQHALGGAGSLPGYSLLSIDCGARSSPYSVLRTTDDGTERHPAYAGYGCDRIALFQAEYRGSFAVDIPLGEDDWDEDWDWYPAVDFSPSWSVFFNAGRGWTLSDETSPGFLGPDTGTFADVGVGFLLGDIGLYWAYPLHGDNKDVNFFLRIDHRF